MGAASLAAISIAAAIVATGCSSGSAPPADPFALIETRLVDDDDGATTGGAPFGGALNAEVTAAEALTTPLLTSLGEGEIEGERVTIAVAPDRANVMVHALNDSGDVLAQVLVEEAPGDGNSVEATPLSSESSLEAALFLRLSRPDALDDNLRFASLRRQTTPELAAVVRAVSASGTADRELEALTRAFHLAQVTEDRAAEENGATVAWDVEELAEAEHAISQTLSSALYRATDVGAREAATQAFVDALVVTRSERSLDARARLEATQAMSFVARARIVTAIEREGADAAVSFELCRTWARLEAIALQRAVDETLVEFDVEESVRADANAVVQDLIDRVSIEDASITTVADLEQAFASSAALLSGAGPTSIFSRALDVNPGTQAGADAAHATALQMQSELDTRLEGTVADMRAISNVAVDAAAESIAGGYAAMRLRLRQSATGLAVFGANGELGLAILLAGGRSFRPIVPAP